MDSHSKKAKTFRIDRLTLSAPNELFSDIKKVFTTYKEFLRPHLLTRPSFDVYNVRQKGVVSPSSENKKRIILSM
ncbi:Uncharacterized protein APZ42_032673 [Daphnia magna]|uniref:Uncharacterized protein n=1 Tax=Daphnia magna TaxID=35525 RepID=A0A164LSG1_9CRUS|nr:Uncharacterized protein APZ42_032673 [Daphnia magna]